MFILYFGCYFFPSSGRGEAWHRICTCKKSAQVILNLVSQIKKRRKWNDFPYTNFLSEQSRSQTENLDLPKSEEVLGLTLLHSCIKSVQVILNIVFQIKKKWKWKNFLYTNFLSEQSWSQRETSDQPSEVVAMILLKAGGGNFSFFKRLACNYFVPAKTVTMLHSHNFKMR